MPAATDEVEEARAEGVKFMFLAAPPKSSARAGGATQGRAYGLGEPDAKGRRKPIGTGKFETIPTPPLSPPSARRWTSAASPISRQRRTAPSSLTSRAIRPASRRFAGGDVVTGPKFAIDAIAAGKEGSISIHRYVHPGQTQNLGRDNRDYKPLDVSTVAVSIGGFDTAPRQKAPSSVRRSTQDLQDLRGTLTEEQIKKEAAQSPRLRARCHRRGSLHRLRCLHHQVQVRRDPS